MALLCPFFAWSALPQPAIAVEVITGEATALASVARSTWTQPATVLAGTAVECDALISVRLVGLGSTNDCDFWTRQVRSLQWTLLYWSAWSQPATVEAGTKGEVDSLAAVRSVVVVSASHCVGGHER